MILLLFDNLKFASAVELPYEPIVIDDALLKALAMIESGNDHNVRGSKGEVSAYQILPVVWKETVGNLYGKPQTASHAQATDVAAKRLIYLIASYKRNNENTMPNAVDIYIMYNGGVSRYKRNSWSPLRTPYVIRERAMRYNNLVLMYRSNN